MQDIVKTRLKDAARLRGIPMAKILRDINLNPGFITDIGRKGDMPSADNLMKFADYLDVSVDYLLGRTDNPTIATSLSANINPAVEGQGDVSGDVINNFEKGANIKMKDSIYNEDIKADMYKLMEFCLHGLIKRDSSGLIIGNAFEDENIAMFIKMSERYTAIDSVRLRAFLNIVRSDGINAPDEGFPTALEMDTMASITDFHSIDEASKYDPRAAVMHIADKIKRQEELRQVSEITHAALNASEG